MLLRPWHIYGFVELSAGGEVKAEQEKVSYKNGVESRGLFRSVISRKPKSLLATSP